VSQLPQITITVDDAAAKLLAKASAQMLPAVLRGLRQTLAVENELTVSHIREKRATGQGPFAPAENRLGVITGRYRRAIRASKAQIVGNTVVAAIGNNVVYAGVHEFGGTFTRTSKPGSVRLRTNARGELIRGSTGGAVFATRGLKRVREVAFAGGKTYTVKVPARAPIGTGIQDRAGRYSAQASASIIATLRGLGLS
jgi:phage gpG-like protein